MNPLTTLQAATLVAEEEGRAFPDRLAELFDDHHRRLYRLARRLTRDEEDALDLVQETFLRGARRPGAVPREPRAAEAWLVRVLVNLCRDRARRLAVRSRASESAAMTASGDPEAAAVARVTVQGALARLPARRRAVLVLCELEGRTVADVARLLGVARVTVRWHLGAARKQLARLLLAEGGGHES